MTVVPIFLDSWTSSIKLEAWAMWRSFNCVHRGFAPGCYGANSKGYTYVIQAEENGLVKIGRSTSQRNRGRKDFDRLAEIQAMSPVRLRVVTLMNGPYLERYWHDRFMKQRVHCEWFRPEIADWFRANGAPGCVRCVEFGDAVRWKREPMGSHRQAADAIQI